MSELLVKRDSSNVQVYLEQPEDVPEIIITCLLQQKLYGKRRLWFFIFRCRLALGIRRYQFFIERDLFTRVYVTHSTLSENFQDSNEFSSALPSSLSRNSFSALSEDFIYSCDDSIIEDRIVGHQQQLMCSVY